MKRLLLAVLVLLLAASADAAVSRVQIKTGSGGPTTASVTFTSATGSGHSIIIAFNAFQAAAGSTYSCSDGGTNTWATDVQKESSDSGNVGICSAHNITGVGSHTVTVTATQTQFGINVVAIEYAGTATSMTLDGTPTSTQSTGTNPNPGNVVTANAGVVVGIVYFLTSGTSTEDAGWTLVSEDDVSYSVIEKITSGSGSYNPVWTLSNSASYATVAAGYKAAAGGVAPTRHLLTLGVGH